MDYDAWLVDLDGTLYRGRPLRVLMAVELLVHGWAVVNPLRVFRRHHELLRAENYDGPLAPYEEQVDRAARELGCPPAQLRAIVERWMIHRPTRWIRVFRRRQLLRELRAFRSAGGKLALVSDYPARAKLEALCAGDLFDCVVANGEPGGAARLKPHPSGFLAAAAALSTPPERCLVVGDRDDADGAAARAAGMAFRRVS